MSTFSKIAQGLRLTGVTGATNDMVGNWLKGVGLAGATPDMLFTYLRSTGLTGSLSDMLSAYVFSSVQDKVLIDLSPTSSGFYSLSTPKTFAGDFEIEAYFVTTVSGELAILGGSTADNNEIVIDVRGGKVRFFASTNSTLNFSLITAPTYSDGKQHKILASYVAGVVTLKVDGINQDTATASLSGNENIGFIGKRSSGRFFNGIISDVKLTDTTTPANSLEFKLNELTANTETNNGVTLTYNSIGTGIDVRDTYTLIGNDYIGSELVVNGDFATDSDWTKGTGTTISGGKANAVDGARFIIQDVGLGVGNNHLVSFDYIETSADKLRVNTGTTNGQQSELLTSVGSTGSGSISGDVTAIGPNIAIEASSATYTGSVDNVSVKRKIGIA
jgi:hypothetical protein